MAEQQPKGHAKSPAEQTTDPYMNKKPLVGKARPRTPAASGAKTSSRASSTFAARSKSNPSTSALRKDTGKAEPKNTADSTEKKVMVSGVTDEVAPIESVFQRETEPVGEEIPTIVERDEYVQSIADQLNPGEEDRGGQEDRDQDSKKSKKDKKPGKKVKKMEKKAEKAEKKVDKLKKKVQKAKKKEVKKSKLRILKEKLIKAFSKWQRRKKKLDELDK